MELKEAIKLAISDNGPMVLAEPRLIKILQEYNAFDDNPMAKTIMESMQWPTCGYMAKLIYTVEYTTREEDINNLAFNYSREGYGVPNPTDAEKIMMVIYDALIESVKDQSSKETASLFYKSEPLSPVLVNSSGSRASYSIDGNALMKFCDSSSFYEVKPGTQIICNMAFFKKQTLEEVVLSKDLTHIGRSAFFGCKSLQSISLPEGLKHLGRTAFMQCESLISISLPESLEFIGDNPFALCPQLHDISCKSSSFRIENQTLYNNDLTHLISYFGTERELILPESVKSIGNYAFAGSCIESIVLPHGLTRIGDYAFGKCNLKSIDLPEGLIHIGKRAFVDCQYLDRITLPESLKSLKAAPFPKQTTDIICKSPYFKVVNKGIYIKDENLPFAKYQKGFDLRHLIQYFGEEQVVELPESLNSIGEMAFANCDNLVSIKIPFSVVYVDSNAFSNCRNLDTVYFRDDVIESVYICSGAFSNCKSLSYICLPNKLVVIGASAFHNCYSLNSVYIPEYVVYVGSGAFRNCTNLRSAGFNKNALHEMISDDIFYGCTSLESISVPYGLEDSFVERFPEWQDYINDGSGHRNRDFDSYGW